MRRNTRKTIVCRSAAPAEYHLSRRPQERARIRKAPPERGKGYPWEGTLRVSSKTCAPVRTFPSSPAGRRKCEGATGSLATLAPDRCPSHPRSTAHGSRLPTISRGGLQVGVGHYTVAASKRK